MTQCFVLGPEDAGRCLEFWMLFHAVTLQRNNIKITVLCWCHATQSVSCSLSLRAHDYKATGISVLHWTGLEISGSDMRKSCKMFPPGGGAGRCLAASYMSIYGWKWSVLVKSISDFSLSCNSYSNTCCDLCNTSHAVFSLTECPCRRK